MSFIRVTVPPGGKKVFVEKVKNLRPAETDDHYLPDDPDLLQGKVRVTPGSVLTKKFGPLKGGAVPGATIIGKSK